MTVRGAGEERCGSDLEIGPAPCHGAGPRPYESLEWQLESLHVPRTFSRGQRGFRVILGLLVLVVMMGVAVAEGSGVISTAVRSVVTTVSGRWLTFAIALTGITG